MAKWGSKIYEPRQGIILHYDASSNDAGAVAWFSDPRCEVSYQFLVTDDGVAHRIAPDDARAYHAGVCQRSKDAPQYKDANSAFYGVSLAATAGDTCTPAAFRTVVRLCVGYFHKHGWGAAEVNRITSHSAEAWPRGRKHDPDGVLDVGEVRREVARTLANLP